MRAVVDSSVLISAFLVRGSLPETILGAASAGRFELVLSPLILTEITRSLNRPKLRRRYGHGEPEIATYITLLEDAAGIVRDLPSIPPTCRDPDDDHVLAAALAAQAEAVVSGDRDLLVLEAFRGIAILTPRAFLGQLEGAKTVGRLPTDC